mgnify:FL=1
MTSASQYGLIGISKLLKKLDIKNKILKYKYYVLVIGKKRNLLLFKDLIGFTIQRKMRRLENIYKLGW